MAEQMKPSGIDWIGDIPESWKVKPLKYLAKCNQDVLLETTAPDYLFRYVDIGSVTYENGITEYQELRFEDSPSRARRRVSVGDTIISTVRTYLKAIAIISDSENVIVSTGFAVYTPDKAIYPRYLYYFCKSEGFVQEIDKNSYGIAYPAINTDLLSRICIAYPCYEDQQAIADFLDKECAQIDSIAADLEKQIALLQQYKKSLITETVTKGLDKSVPMKDSGVEWIGEIPVGWELSRIKYLTDNHHPYPIGDGDHGMIKADDYLTEGIPYIRVLNLTWGSGLNLENLVFISKEMNSLIKNSELKPNDILIAKTGATIGKTAIVPDSLPVSNTTSHVGKITLANVHDAKYFYYVMTSSIVQKQIQDISAMQSTRPELGIEGLKNLILTVPPFDIQQHIARFLDDHCAKIDRVLHEKGKQLSVIKQHKKSLIYEYVTGKKRVKEVQ